MPRFLFFLIASALFTQAGTSGADKPTYGPVKSMSPEEFDREASQSVHYDFELASPDGLVDADGTKIRSEDLTAYLREKHCDTAGYFLLWITRDSPPLDRTGVTVDPLGRYGAKKIVFRQKVPPQPRPILREFHPAAGTPPDRKRVTMIGFRPNPHSIIAGSPFPELASRPIELRPEALPPRVRYAFGSDAAMATAAGSITDHLVSVLPSQPPLFASAVTVQSGLWKAIISAGTLGKKHATPWSTIDPNSPAKDPLPGMTLSDPDEILALEATLAKLISAGGGGEVHALRTAEMARWWPYVGFDYVEPVLVLTTRDHAHVFTFLFESGRVSLIDDLKGLPSLPLSPSSTRELPFIR